MYKQLSYLDRVFHTHAVWSALFLTVALSVCRYDYHLGIGIFIAAAAFSLLIPLSWIHPDVPGLTTGIVPAIGLGNVFPALLSLAAIAWFPTPFAELVTYVVVMYLLMTATSEAFIYDWVTKNAPRELELVSHKLRMILALVALPLVIIIGLIGRIA